LSKNPKDWVFAYGTRLSIQGCIFRNQTCYTGGMSLLRVGGSRAVALGAFLACSCLLKATSTSPKSTGVFDSSLLNHAVGSAACRQPCMDGRFQEGLEGFMSDVSPTSTSAFNAVVLPASYDSTAVLNPTSNRAENEDDGILHVDPRWGMKKFLLIALFLGGLVRFFTSATYLKFISEVLDPLSF